MIWVGFKGDQGREFYFGRRFLVLSSISKIGVVAGLMRIIF